MNVRLFSQFYHDPYLLCGNVFYSLYSENQDVAINSAGLNFNKKFELYNRTAIMFFIAHSL